MEAPWAVGQDEEAEGCAGSCREGGEGGHCIHGVASMEAAHASHVVAWDQDDLEKENVGIRWHLEDSQGRIKL